MTSVKRTGAVRLQRAALREEVIEERHHRGFVRERAVAAEPSHRNNAAHRRFEVTGSHPAAHTNSGQAMMAIGRLYHHPGRVLGHVEAEEVVRRGLTHRSALVAFLLRGPAAIDG
jgi:hypothetical protein